ncbi:MAG: helix-turn-helix transcriptional regulator [Paludibacteraceae bacterium]|nr:helix-turn-helix transcriptional regulator [Paludibacteraceae bacterium]
MNDLTISNNVRENIKRILNENRNLRQQDFADAINMDKSQFHRMINTPTAIDVDYVVIWKKWLNISWTELIEKPIRRKQKL